MDFCPNSEGKAGFATPAAAVVCLAMATVMSALMLAAAATLRAERSNYHRVQVGYALDAAQSRAAIQILNGRQQGASRWADAGFSTQYEVVAEPELPKLALRRAAKLPDTDFQRWGIASPDRLRAILQQLAAATPQSAHRLWMADPSSLWMMCARTAISPFGAADELKPPAPGPNTGASAGHEDQIWRVRIASDDGWVDDRIIRFTGSPTRPIVVAGQWFGHGAQMGDACARLYASATD